MQNVLSCSFFKSPTTHGECARLCTLSLFIYSLGFDKINECNHNYLNKNSEWKHIRSCFLDGLQTRGISLFKWFTNIFSKTKMTVLLDYTCKFMKTLHFVYLIKLIWTEVMLLSSEVFLSSFLYNQETQCQWYN